MTKMAILVDGGYFLKRLPAFRHIKNLNGNVKNPEFVDGAIRQLVATHLAQQNKIIQAPDDQSLLYRVFYYDGEPYLKREELPISKRSIDYANTEEAKFRLDLFDILRRTPNTAVRLGNVQCAGKKWILKEHSQDNLLKGNIKAEDLTDDDFVFGFQQKAVDMRIGIDIATLTLKKQVDTIILVSGDADFVPASKLARREGVRVILDPLWRSVSSELFEHIDGVSSGFPSP